MNKYLTILLGSAPPLSLTALLAASSVGATGEPPRVEAREIGDELSQLNGNGYDTNIGLLVGREAAVLIDPSPGEAQLDALHETVRVLVANAEVWIVNTHDHPRHWLHGRRSTT